MARPTQETLDALVIGAGQAGLATGYFLKQAGLRFALLEARDAVGGSWQSYWDSLRVFSPARYSQLPGMDFPGDPHRYPTRHEVITYLRQFADHFALPICTGAKVESVMQQGELFLTHTADGRHYASRALIAATGPFNKPSIPQIPGQADYQGRTLHSFDYADPKPFKGQRVVVIGANNSAVQVGVEVAAVARASLALRRPIEWLPKRMLGRSLFFWIHNTGFDMLPLGLWFDLKDSNHVIDDGTLRRAVEAGQPDARAMFTRFTADGVIWPDGSRESVDTVIYATGYRPDNMPYLAKLGALDARGRPLQRGGISTVVERLYTVGVFGQRAPASATLRGVGRDARLIVRRLQHDLART